MALSQLFINTYDLDFYQVQFNEVCTVTVSKDGRVGVATSEQGEFLTALTACEEIGIDTSTTPTVPSGYHGPTATPTDMLLQHIKAEDPHGYLDLIQRQGGRRSEKLRRWRAAVGGRDTSPAIWVAVGDSVTEGAYGAPIERIRTKLAHYNDGRVSAGWVNASTAAYALRPYRFSLTTGIAGGSEAAANHNRSVGLANLSYGLGAGSVLTLQELTPGLTLQNSTPFASEIEFYWTKSNNPGAQLEFRVNGTLVYTADCHDGTLGAGVTDSGYSYKHTLATRTTAGITVTGVGATAIFDGCYIADGDKVRIYNAGKAGAVFADVTKTSHYQFLKKLSPDLVSVGMGLNNYGAGATAFGAMFKAYHDGVEAFLGSDLPSWFFAVPYKALSRTDWPVYVEAAKNALQSLGLVWTDLNAAMGDVSGPDPWALSADDIHLTAAGGELYAATVLEALGEGVTPGAALGSFTANYGFGKWSFAPDANNGSAANLYADRSAAHPGLRISTFLGFIITLFGSGLSAPAYNLVYSPYDGSIYTGGGAFFKTVSATKSADYTLVLADAGTRLIMNSGSGKTITIPLHASVAWPADTWFDVVNRGSGTLTLSCPSGTLLGTTSLAQGDSVKLVRLAQDVWQAG